MMHRCVTMTLLVLLSRSIRLAPPRQRRYLPPLLGSSGIPLGERPCLRVLRATCAVHISSSGLIPTSFVFALCLCGIHTIMNGSLRSPTPCPSAWRAQFWNLIASPPLSSPFAAGGSPYPLQAFYDDFRIVEPEFSCESGFEFFKRISELVGWSFDPDKDQPPADAIKMLGNIEDWSLSYKNQFLVSSTPERLQAIGEAIISCVKSQSCGRSAAASIRGKLLHIAATRPW